MICFFRQFTFRYYISSCVFVAPVYTGSQSVDIPESVTSGALVTPLAATDADGHYNALTFSVQNQVCLFEQEQTV